MRGFLLDTNVLSELRKGRRCDAGVRNWIESTSADQLFVSVLVLGEIRKGIERIRTRDQNQARALEQWLRKLSGDFSEHLLPVDERVADRWGRLGWQQPVPTLDALLAATALVHDLTVVSRDQEGFAKTGVRLVNPFAKPQSPGN